MDQHKVHSRIYTCGTAYKCGNFGALLKCDTRMKNIFLFLLVLVVIKLPAQTTDKPFIRLAMPGKENNAVRNSKQFISGATCKNCSLSVNGVPVKVYPTGGFACELDLKPGTNVVNILATAGKAEANKKTNLQFFAPGSGYCKNDGEFRVLKHFPKGICWFLPEIK
jgi:N-acetylmuramoyl-L-alanine amidase